MIKTEYKNLTELYEDLVFLPFTNPGYLDLIESKVFISRSNYLYASSTDFEMDLASVGFTKGRWVRFLDQYLSYEAYETWLTRIKSQTKKVENLLPTKEVTEHTWGKCVLGITLSLYPKPLLTLYSRTALLPTTAALELVLCSLCADEIKKIIKEPLSFCWFAGTIQWRLIELIPYLVSQEQAPGLISTYEPLRKTWNQVFSPEVPAYKLLKRMRDDSIKLQAGTFIPVPIQSLSLTRRINRGRVEDEFDGVRKRLTTNWRSEEVRMASKKWREEQLKLKPIIEMREQNALTQLQEMGEK